ncbi:hypothetical protein STEG23_019726 [Scotinomys teguina]
MTGQAKSYLERHQSTSIETSFKRYLMELERWFSGYECLLLSQRMLVQFPEHSPDGLLVYVSAAGWYIAGEYGCPMQTVLCEMTQVEKNRNYIFSHRQNLTPNVCVYKTEVVGDKAYFSDEAVRVYETPVQYVSSLTESDSWRTYRMPPIMEDTMMALKVFTKARVGIPATDSILYENQASGLCL